MSTAGRATATATATATASAPTPLVTLHGFTGRADDWAAADPAGAARRLALIGHSPELPVPPGHDFAAEVARLAAAIEPIARRAPVHLAGYSMGGRLALAIALARPSLVARLTVIGAHPGLPADDDAARAERRAADARRIARLAAGDLDGFVAAWEAEPMWASQRTLPPARLAAQRAVRLGHDPRQLAAALACLGLAAQPDLGARLDDLAPPTTFVAGALDARFADLARRAATAAPRGRAVLIDGAGHNPLIEQPARVAEIIGGDAP